MSFGSMITRTIARNVVKPKLNMSNNNGEFSVNLSAKIANPNEIKNNIASEVGKVTKGIDMLKKAPDFIKDPKGTMSNIIKDQLGNDLMGDGIQKDIDSMKSDVQSSMSDMTNIEGSEGLGIDTSQYMPDIQSTLDSSFGTDQLNFNPDSIVDSIFSKSSLF